MDFTYFVAAFIAIVMGFVAGIVFVAIKGKSNLRLLAAASALAFALDWLLLFNWAHIGDVPAAELQLVLRYDLLFFAIYSVVGCAIGAFPMLLGRYLWRRRPGQDRSQ